MVIREKYKLKVALPRYEAGTVVYCDRTWLPSQYNDQNYLADSRWFTKQGSHEVMAIPYVGMVIERAVQDQNVDTDDWVEVLGEKEIE